MCEPVKYNKFCIIGRFAGIKLPVNEREGNYNARTLIISIIILCNILLFVYFSIFYSIFSLVYPICPFLHQRTLTKPLHHKKVNVTPLGSRSLIPSQFPIRFFFCLSVPFTLNPFLGLSIS